MKFPLLIRWSKSNPCSPPLTKGGTGWPRKSPAYCRDDKAAASTVQVFRPGVLRGGFLYLVLGLA
jgi:hypothetical protein